MSILEDNFLKRVAFNIEMSFDIPESEKKIASEAKILFESARKALSNADEHLEIIYEPFKKHDMVSPESIKKGRGILHRFKEASVEMFNNFKQKSFFAINKLSYFSKGDQDIQELNISFEDSVREMEEPLNELYDSLRDYEDTDFRNRIVKSVEDTKAGINIIYDLIDRIIEHIDINLLVKSWMSDVSENLNIDPDENISYIIQLYRDRQKTLSGNMPQTSKDQQPMNPSDTPKIHYPDRTRTTNTGE